jgi:hypothetical protein
MPLDFFSGVVSAALADKVRTEARTARAKLTDFIGILLEIGCKAGESTARPFYATMVRICVPLAQLTSLSPLGK